MLRGNHELRDVNGWIEHYGERSFLWQCQVRRFNSSTSSDCHSFRHPSPFGVSFAPVPSFSMLLLARCISVCSDFLHAARRRNPGSIVVIFEHDYLRSRRERDRPPAFSILTTRGLSPVHVMLSLTAVCSCSVSSIAGIRRSLTSAPPVTYNIVSCDIFGWVGLSTPDGPRQ